MIGKTISHYKILEKLGEGGMGVVYKAEDMKLKRFVALKFLPPELTRDSEAKERFILEAQAASALEHSNICNIHEIDETDDGQMFISMAHYEGETLKKRIEKGPLKLDEALDIAIQISEGLNKAQGKDIVHRDIKPANIFLTNDGVTKILDFGLAKLAGRTKLTKTGTTIGTASYMSPEQSRGEEVDCRSDIWSLGVMLYEMVTGQLPFKGDYEQAVVYSIVNEEPEPLTAIRTGVPMELERIVNKALKKNYAERYQNVGDLLVDLKGLGKDVETGVKSGPLAVVEKKGRKTLIRRVSIPVGIALILVLAFFMIKSFLSEDVLGSARITIAVLPLTSFVDTEEEEFFRNSMTAEMIMDLSRISGLSVIARHSVMPYVNTDKPIDRIARELGVKYIIECSILRDNEKIRILPNLIEAETGLIVWGDSYERDYGEILRLQAEISRIIAREVKVKLTPEEEAIFAGAHIVSPEAHDAYLKGLHHFNRTTLEGTRTSIDYFKKAIEIDSMYAMAYAGLAQAYYSPGIEPQPLKETMPKARAAALKAIELDPTLGWPHMTLGTIKLFNDWDILGSENEYKQALELTPNDERMRIIYAQLLNLKGKHKEAVKEAIRAKRLDPLNLFVSMNLAYRYVLAGQYNKAIQESQHVIELDPNFAFTYNVTGLAYLALKENDKALQAFEKLDSLSAGNDMLKSVAAYGYANLGKTLKAKAILENILAESGSRYVNPMWVARVYTGLGDKDKAFEALEEAFEERTEGLIWIDAFLEFKGLHSDSRFEVLVKKVGCRIE